MTMILLTPAQADQVRGPTSPMSALMPRELADGNFVLPIAVLNDPAHAIRHDFLATLPTIPDPLPDDYPAANMLPGATGPI